MPSVFTIAGADSPKRKHTRTRTRGGAPMCKQVRRPRGGGTQKLCFVGKSKKHPTGWSFVKNNSKK